MLVVMLQDMLVTVPQLMLHKDYTMKLLISTVVVLAPLLAVSPAFAVDRTISPLCRSADSVYQRPGGFCDHVAAYGSQGPKASGGCPAGTIRDPHNGACIPV